LCHEIQETTRSSCHFGEPCPADIPKAFFSSRYHYLDPDELEKKWRRGFNQSELISQYISKRSGIPCLPLLTEKSGAQSQKKLGLRDRFIHSLNRYNTTSARGLSGRKVLIVDDVYTTGATINECARQLRLAGAEDVFSLTIARTDLKRLEKF